MQELVNIDTLKLSVRKNDAGQHSLTDLWKLSGGKADKAPAQWIRQDETQGFIKATGRFLKCVPETLLKSSRGKGGGTWAHEQIFLEYAQYLDPRLAVIVNQAFFERLEEEANPEKILDRYERTYRKQGKADSWINKRLKGRSTRNKFTSTLKAHGVHHQGYQNCTNAIYDGLYGGTTEVVRLKKNLPEKVNIRDNMSELELIATEFAEALSVDNIEKKNLRGNGECELECKNCSRIVGQFIVKSRAQV